MELNPIVFAKGDETTADVSQIVVDSIFKQCPRINIPLNVSQRVATKDGCIADWAEALKELGAGVKMSTASKHPDITKLGLGSANIKLREATGVVGMFRMIFHPRNFSKSVAVLRYGNGGFYNEVGCNIVTENEVEYMYVTSKMNLSDLKPFAEMAMKLAKQNNFNLRVSSKWTISASERIFMERITNVFEANGLTEKTNGDGDFEKILTDVGLAEIASRSKGGWLWLFDNPNGDSASDIADFSDGSRSMCSTLFCRDQSWYEELPGGTAPDFIGCKNFVNNEGNFFNPAGIILSIMATVKTANPEHSSWVDSIGTALALYLAKTPESEMGTMTMINHISKVANS